MRFTTTAYFAKCPQMLTWLANVFAHQCSSSLFQGLKECPDSIQLIQLIMEAVTVALHGGTV